jgi:hypothetical protein
MRKRPIKARDDNDEMRPENDLSKLKFIGRGIYAERFRAGVKLVLLGDNEAIDEHDAKEDRLNEQPRNISNPER